MDTPTWWNWVSMIYRWDILIFNILTIFSVQIQKTPACPIFTPHKQPPYENVVNIVRDEIEKRLYSRKPLNLWCYNHEMQRINTFSRFFLIMNETVDEFEFRKIFNDYFSRHPQVGIMQRVRTKDMDKAKYKIYGSD